MPSFRMVSNWLVIWDLYKVPLGFGIGFRLRPLPLNFDRVCLNGQIDLCTLARIGPSKACY